MTHQNKNDNNKDNMISKLIRGLIGRHPVNPPNTKKTELLGYLEGVLPTVGDHPDFNLED